MSKNKRIHPRLLILLWIWAILMFVVVDLFRNVPEFDRVRPEWHTYKKMRLAAHRLVDEPSDFAVSTPTAIARTLGTELARVDRLADFELLVETALDESIDPRVRGRSMRRIATDFAPAARDVLAAIAFRGGESTKVRGAAARYLARAGAVTEAERLADDPCLMVRRGARVGLAELGTANAAKALLDREADDALALILNPEAIPVLADAAATNPAACAALGNTKSPDAVRPLVATLQDKGVHPRIRAAAVDALGRLGRSEALDAINAACQDWHACVVKKAELARQRLTYQQ